MLELNQFRKQFFRNVTDQPLSPDDPRYEPLYTEGSLALEESDPVELMAWSIESTPGESVQLLSGFRGTGKTTELKRLQKRLQSDYIVIFTDLDDYLNVMVGGRGAFAPSTLSGHLAPARARCLRSPTSIAGRINRGARAPA